MTDKEKLIEIKTLVDLIEEEKMREDVYSDSGGNFDDAYNMGIDYGFAALAKTIRNILNDKKDNFTE